ncbi:MAG: alpha/beta hydrolase [Bacteroidia bacterium]|nr:alpha/beta hydrolase [Bacteroidia bacterium]
MKNIFLLIILSLTMVSCQRLDPMLYNNDNNITEYKLDKFTKDIDFILDNSYTIHDSLINPLVLESQSAKETSSTKIRGFYIGNINRITTDTVIMYCHGNKWHMDFYWQRAKLLANVGKKNRFGVMMIDYRGFGLSEGKPTEQGMYADVNAALLWLKQKGLTNDRLVIYGFSLGSASATEMASNNTYHLTPSKLMLEAPFASSAVLVQDGSKLALSPKYFTDTKIDNAEKIKKVQQPFYWIHGIADDYLSIKTHGEVIYKNYHGVLGEAHRIPNANHGSVPNTFGFKNYTESILKFIIR